MQSQNTHIDHSHKNFNDTKGSSTGTAPWKKPPCYEEVDAVLGDEPTTISLHLISSSGTGSDWSVGSNDSDSDAFDDEGALKNLMDATNVPISVCK